MTARRLPEIRVYFAWWTWPLVYAVLPFAMLAALYDYERARAGIIRTAACGIQMHVGGRKVRGRAARALVRMVMLGSWH